MALPRELKAYINNYKKGWRNFNNGKIKSI